MKQFNLDEYLKDPNQKVVSREGIPVKIHCTNYTPDKPVVAEIEGLGYSSSYSANGSKHDTFKSPEDLFFASRERWMNIYKSKCDVYPGRIFFSTKEEAEDTGRKHDDYVATARVELEE